MIMNPKIGDYIWFICRWTDLPVLGQVTSLKIDPANKNFPYEMKDLTQRLIGIMEKIHQSQAHGAAVHLYC